MTEKTEKTEKKNRNPGESGKYNLYWGDIHNHCGITYGYGGLENALEAAKGQLDFCHVTGHAMYPDMLKGVEELTYSNDYHLKGFEKLRDRWETVRKTMAEANKEGEFVTFQGYEIHSRLLGDHHILSPEDDLPLIEADSHIELVEILKKRAPESGGPDPREVIAVPHHVAYTPGYRSIDWDYFREEISPVVEVHSKHGCGMSEYGPYPYLHQMGPRDPRNTVYAGLLKGKRFGFTGSTDHHAGYPGSYGDGRVAVLAEEKSRKAVWEALLSRRCYAVTGDKIECDFNVNGNPMGSIISPEEKMRIALSLRGSAPLEMVWIYKNLIPWKVLTGKDLANRTSARGSSADKTAVPGRYKVRIEMGWGNNREGYDWKGTVRIKDGRLIAVEPCFRGQSILAPSKDIPEDDEINNLNNRVEYQSEDEVRWQCTTFKNPSTQHSQTNAVILEIEGDRGTVLDFSVNSINHTASLEELAEAGRSFHVKEWTSQALLIHTAVPEDSYTFRGEWEDSEVRQAEARGTDFYHAEVRQSNNQWAWISPVFVQG